MKATKWLGLATVTAVLAACNGSNNNESNPDSTTVTTATTTQTTSSGNYAAMADSFRVNSQAGNYLDARTGKPLRIRYDATSHRAINEETNTPVWRYVDRRNWWVYGADNDTWNQVGEARMDGSSLKYKNSTDDTWVDYDQRWSTEDQRYMSDSSWTMTYSTTDENSTGSAETNGEVKVKDNGNKVKDDDVKVKTSKDGDIKIKDRQTGEKAKYDAQTGKVKSGN
jgi:hypothetical protein